MQIREVNLDSLLKRTRLRSLVPSPRASSVIYTPATRLVLFNPLEKHLIFDIVSALLEFRECHYEVRLFPCLHLSFLTTGSFAKLHSLNMREELKMMQESWCRSLNQNVMDAVRLHQLKPVQQFRCPCGLSFVSHPVVAPLTIYIFQLVRSNSNHKSRMNTKTV